MRPAYLDNPHGLRTRSRATDPARDACAVEWHPAGTRTERILGVMVAVIVGVLGALALVHWAAS